MSKHDWPGLKSVVVVESTREFGGKIDREMARSRAAKARFATGHYVLLFFDRAQLTRL
jgi:hypothetical protein